jgi:hypothetical protein
MPGSTVSAGFLFTAKDKLSKTLVTINKGFGSLEQKLKTVAAGASKFGKDVGAGLSRVGGMGRKAIGGVTGALDQMANRALNPKIDSAFSSMYATFSKTYGELTSGMNMSGKESKKWYKTISSASYGLNADMGQTAKSWMEFRKQNINLTEALGGKGTKGAIKNLIKITATMGIEGSQLAQIFSTLGKGFGFTTKRTRALVDTVFKMGKAFNVGQEMMQEMPGIIQDISKGLADFGVEAKPEDVEKMTLSIVKLGIGFKESLGMNAKDAIATSKNMFNTLLGERTNLVNMFRGMPGELGAIGTALGEKGGIKKALSMILTDPRTFMDKLREVAKKTAKSGGKMSVGFQRLVGSMNKALGPDVTFAMKKNWDGASKAMAKLDKISENTIKNLGALSKAANKAYKTGLTQGDGFKRMLDAQDARIKSLTAPMLTTWIKEQSRGFNKFYKVLSKTSKKKGPLGEVTRRLLLMQRVGLSGLFSGMGGAAPMFMKTLQTMGPMLTALAALGMSLASLGKLLLPGGIILVGLAMFNKNMREKLVGTVQKAFLYLQENIPKWWPMMKEGLTELWAKSLEGVRWLMDVVSPMMGYLAKAIDRVDWGGLTTKVLGYLGSFFQGIGNAFFGGDALTVDTKTAEGRFAVAGGKLLSALGRGAQAAGKVVLKGLWEFLFVWSDKYGSTFTKKMKLIGGVALAAMFFGWGRKFLWIAAKHLVMALKIAAQWIIAGGPIVWLLAGIAAVGAAILVMGANWDTTKKKAAEYWDLAKGGVKNMLNDVSTYIGLTDAGEGALNRFEASSVDSWVSMGSVAQDALDKIARDETYEREVDKIGKLQDAVSMQSQAQIKDIWDAKKNFTRAMGVMGNTSATTAHYSQLAWNKSFNKTNAGAMNSKLVSTQAATAKLAGEVFSSQNSAHAWGQSFGSMQQGAIATEGVAISADDKKLQAANQSSNKTTTAWDTTTDAVKGGFGVLKDSAFNLWTATAAFAKQSAIKTAKAQLLVLKASGKANEQVFKTVTAAVDKLAGMSIRLGYAEKSMLDLSTKHAKNKKELILFQKLELEQRSKLITMMRKSGLDEASRSKMLKKMAGRTLQGWRFQRTSTKDFKTGEMKFYKKTQGEQAKATRMTAIGNLRVFKEKSVDLMVSRLLPQALQQEYGRTAVTTEAVNKMKAYLRKRVLKGDFSGREIGKGSRVTGLVKSSRKGSRSGGRVSVSRTKAKLKVEKPTTMASGGFSPTADRKEAVVSKDISQGTKTAMNDVGRSIDNLSMAVGSMSKQAIRVNIYGDLKKFLKWQRSGNTTTLTSNG